LRRILSLVFNINKYLLKIRETLLLIIEKIKVKKIPHNNGKHAFFSKIRLVASSNFWLSPHPPSGGTSARVEASLLLAQSMTITPSTPSFIYFPFWNESLRLLFQKGMEWPHLSIVSELFNRIRSCLYHKCLLKNQLQLHAFL
jgi:hypothetical protein